MKRKWIFRLAIGFGVCFAALLILPFLISLEGYIPLIEKEASQKLKVPVTMKSIRLALLPLPHVTVGQISVGRSDEVRIEKATVTPDLFSLLGSTKVIRSIEIDKLIITQKGFDRIPEWSRPDATQGQQAPAVRVETIRLVNALATTGKISIGPFDAQVRLNAQGIPEDATFSTRDGQLKANIKPDQSRYLIDATAKSWQVPVGPAVEFDELTVRGVATLNEAELNEVSAKLYGGTAAGKVTVNWQKGLRIKGNLDISRVELKAIVPLLAPGTNMSGKLTAKPVFSATANDAGQLMNALRLETPFRVENGVLHGVDIKQAATSLLKQGTKGGETRFDQLSGQFNMDRRTMRLTQIKVVSGVLAANGNVTISPKKELSGRINAEVQALGASTGVPLNVSGTLDSPLLYPTGGFVAGAAVGTAVLGPGLGTSIGAKVGNWASNLFGNKEENKR